MKDKVIIKKVKQCSRCGGTHLNIEAKRFERPVKDEDRNFNYWAMCPNSYDPILIAVTE